MSGNNLEAAANLLLTGGVHGGMVDRGGEAAGPGVGGMEEEEDGVGSTDAVVGDPGIDVDL